MSVTPGQWAPIVQQVLVSWALRFRQARRPRAKRAYQQWRQSKLELPALARI